MCCEGLVLVQLSTMQHYRADNCRVLLVAVHSLRTIVLSIRTNVAMGG